MAPSLYAMVAAERPLQHPEFRPALVIEHDRSPVKDGGIHGQAPRLAYDRREPLGRAIAARCDHPHLDELAVHGNSVPVPFHLKDPVGPLLHEMGSVGFAGRPRRAKLVLL